MPDPACALVAPMAHSVALSPALRPSPRSARVVDIDCYYSLSSPWAYFAGPRLQDIARRHRARLTLKPYDFQAVVPKTGGVPLRTRPEPRRRYHEIELDRWRKHLGMPLVLR